MAMLDVVSEQQERLLNSRSWQEHYERELENYGRRVPAPIYGEGTGHYRRRTCEGLKGSFLYPSHERYKIDYLTVPADAFPILEQQLLEVCKQEAYNPAALQPGEFREIVKTDSRNGQKIHEFVGKESFVKGFCAPPRHARIRTPDNEKDREWFRNLPPNVARQGMSMVHIFSPLVKTPRE